MRHRIRGLTAIALLAAVAAAGCSDPSPEPDDAPAPESSAGSGGDGIAAAPLVPRSGGAVSEATQDAPPTADAALAEDPHAASIAASAAELRDPPVHQRDVGDARIRFWVERAVRTGRGASEHHFAASVENRGGSLLRGALWVTSSEAATRVVAACVPFGTTPPGTIRAADGEFVLAQDRRVAFAPDALDFTITPTDVGCADPGRVTLRRLNRSEYDHAVRELLGTTRRPAREFPADDSTFGFDTIADSLALSPLLFEKLDVAAVRIVAESLAADPPSPQVASLRSLCDPALEGAAVCHRRVLEAFARRAWRRPIAPDEVESLGRVADRAVAAGGDFDSGLADALEAVLLSPHFVFRVERDAHGRSVEVHPLTDHELATRLSFFLWSSPPDDELDALADAGSLHEPATLAAQVSRLLQDPKSERFVDDFTGQWLATRALDDVSPDYPYFASWDEELKESLRRETHRFVGDLMRSDGSFLALLDAQFTYLNDRLAAHYGLPAPGTSEMVRVALAPDATRGGILTHGSLHAVTSFPRRTSPVKRGKLVLDQLLCVEIDPPPAGVEGFLTDPTHRTLREQLAAHRSDPACASCHAYLDPVGLALEHYGPIGGWRSTDLDGAIDASGTLPDGRSFADARELAALLAVDPQTARCIVERVLVYALGRGLRPGDTPHVDAIVAAFAASGHRFESLLVAIAQSPPFRLRRGQPEEGAP